MLDGLSNVWYCGLDLLLTQRLVEVRSVVAVSEVPICFGQNPHPPVFGFVSDVYDITAFEAS